MDNNVINMFKDKPKLQEESLLEFWKGRNAIIASTFMDLSVYQKQEILEPVLGINNSLYEMILKLKGKTV